MPESKNFRSYIVYSLLTITDKYCKTKDGRVYACFIDFHKAFDTVIHSGIKIKLLKIGVGTNFYQVIQSMYSSSKSCVRLSNCMTDFFPIKVGVKQGDNLSPNLFKASRLSQLVTRSSGIEF